MFENFLLLHVPIYILTSPHLYELYNTVADELLREFVTHAKNVFGRQFIVYNVHSLIHVAAECLHNGPLDTFSTFKYESYLKDIRNTLQSGYRPLQQLAKRYTETGGHLIKPKTTQDPGAVKLSCPHEIDEDIEGTQYKKVELKKLLKRRRQLLRHQDQGRCCPGEHCLHPRRQDCSSWSEVTTI